MNRETTMLDVDELLAQEDRAEMALLRLVGSVGLALLVLGLALRLVG